MSSCKECPGKLQPNYSFDAVKRFTEKNLDCLWREPENCYLRGGKEIWAIDIYQEEYKIYAEDEIVCRFCRGYKPKLKTTKGCRPVARCQSANPVVPPQSLSPATPTGVWRAVRLPGESANFQRLYYYVYCYWTPLSLPKNTSCTLWT